MFKKAELSKLGLESRPVNTGRQKELDMAKGFTIIIMAWDHVLENTGASIKGFWPVFLDDILAGPMGAPVFMICMGIGICYTGNNSPADLAKRGLGLIIISFALNVAQYLIPDIIWNIISNGTPCADIFDDMVFSDILPFAGLSFLLFALLKKCKTPDWALFATGAVFSIAGTLIRWTATGIYKIDCLLGFIWGTGSESYFPLLNWFIFPCMIIRKLITTRSFLFNIVVIIHSDTVNF